MAISFQTWMILVFLGNILSWRWMFFLNRRNISSSPQQCLMIWRQKHLKKNTILLSTRRTRRLHLSELKFHSVSLVVEMSMIWSQKEKFCLSCLQKFVSLGNHVHLSLFFLYLLYLDFEFFWRILNRIHRSNFKNYCLTQENGFMKRQKN